MGRLAKNEIYFGGYIPLKDTLRAMDRIQKSEVDEIARSIFAKTEDISITILGNTDKEKIEHLWKS
jgi:predicted Zn-dependent peptidase